jgi:hypothetical protein
MSEWRTLPEFPNYEITADGDVRNRDTKKVLKEVYQATNDSYHYSLWNQSHTRNTCRHFWGLVYSAWPELREGWVDIPGFPGYQITLDGTVQHTRLYKDLPVTKAGGVVLRTNGRRKVVRVKDLLELTFPELREEDVA